MVCVYFDDLLVTGSSLRMIIEFKDEMASKYEMSDLGKLTYYLDVEVLQHDGGIVLSQDRYTQKILEEAGMHNCNLTHIPMDVNIKLSKASSERDIDEKNIEEA